MWFWFEGLPPDSSRCLTWPGAGNRLPWFEVSASGSASLKKWANRVPPAHLNWCGWGVIRVGDPAQTPYGETKAFQSSTPNLKIHVHEWIGCISASLYTPIWVNCASDLLKHPPLVLIHFNRLQWAALITSALWHALPLLLSQTNYSGFTTQQTLLTKGQLTDPHRPRIHGSVWSFEAADVMLH